MFNIIDRYIAGEFIKYFLGALVVFTTLFLAVEMLSSVWELKASSALIWKYYLLSLPTILYRMTPVSALMGTIFTVSVLGRNNELVALFSSGISLARATAPIIAMSVLITISSFIVSDKLIPPFTKKMNYVKSVEIKKNPSLYYTVKTNKIWYRSKDLIYNIKTFNPEKKAVEGLTIYYFDPEFNLTQVTTAKIAHFEGKNWTLKDGTVTLFPTSSSFPITSPFKEKLITLDEGPADIQDIGTDQDVMTVGELRKYIQKNKEAGLDTVQYEVTYHNKFSFAFISVVMAFLGIPFSVSKARSGGFALNVGICLGFVFAYWTLVSIFLSLGKHGTIPPAISAWTPNALMLVVAVYFLLRLKR